MADEHVINFRATEEVHGQLRTLAADEDRSCSSWLVHVIRQRYEARFGEALPKKGRKR